MRIVSPGAMRTGPIPTPTRTTPTSATVRPASRVAGATSRPVPPAATRPVARPRGARATGTASLPGLGMEATNEQPQSRSGARAEPEEQEVVEVDDSPVLPGRRLRDAGDPEQTVDSPD